LVLTTAGEARPKPAPEGPVRPPGRTASAEDLTVGRARDRGRRSRREAWGLMRALKGRPETRSGGVAGGSRPQRRWGCAQEPAMKRPPVPNLCARAAGRFTDRRSTNSPLPSDQRAEFIMLPNFQPSANDVCRPTPEPAQGQATESTDLPADILSPRLSEVSGECSDTPHTAPPDDAADIQIMVGTDGRVTAPPAVSAALAEAGINTATTAWSTSPTTSPAGPGWLAQSPTAPPLSDQANFATMNAAREEQIRQITTWLRLLVARDQVVELRALEVVTLAYRRPHTVSGFFDYQHLERMVEHALDLFRRCQGRVLHLRTP